MINRIDITDFPDAMFGNAENKEAGTGCTVIICEKGAVAGVDVRGGAPGTRETDLLNPLNLIEKVHAIMLTGGSAFGLDAASGVMEYLENKNIGFDVGVTKVPIVPAAVLFDLTVGNPRIRPDKEMGYLACINAEKGDFHLGNNGAGTGASVGKIFKPENAMKGGLGASCFKIGELYVAALVAVNCLGDVIDPKSGKIIAGAVGEDGKSFLDSESFIIENLGKRPEVFAGNTSIGVVITNGILTKSQANKIASIAQDGYARTIKPSHTINDGDTIFAMSTSQVEVDITILGVLARKAIEEAVINGVMYAKSAYGLKSVNDFTR